MTKTDISQAIDYVNRLRKREFREETGQTIVEGYPEVSRAVKAKVAVEVLYICPEIFQDTNNEFGHCPVVEVTKDEFARMAFGSRLKGILAVCKPNRLTLENLKLRDKPFLLIIEGVEKPGNIGTVIRTCDGAGIDAVIVCDGKTDVYNHNVVRSSIGTLFTIPVVETSQEETAGFLEKNNIQLFAASAKAEKDYTQCQYSTPSAIILGNEHDGVSSFWKERVKHFIRIPMQGEASSLNVSVSAAILIYEVVRQRNLAT